MFILSRRSILASFSSSSALPFTSTVAFSFACRETVSIPIFRKYHSISTITANSSYHSMSPQSSQKYDMTSDTATQPTDEMFDIMKSASRGDDVFEDDASVKQLETYVARLLGKEAALFCASGTMTNQLGLRLLLTQPPHSVLCDARSHVYNYECGGIAYHSQASVSPVMPKNGHHLTAEDIASNLLTDPSHTAVTKVLSLENTLNGTIMPLDEIQRIHALAQQQQLKMHLDGARLWNASQETGIPLHVYGQYFDTISLCLSKGVGAPIGSILVSTKANITRARQLRKLMGGGWRQAGCLASAALHCIQTVVPTMKQTHQLTRKLANAFVEQFGMSLTVPCETNMIWIKTTASKQQQQRSINNDSKDEIPSITVHDLAQALRKKNIYIAGGDDKESTETRLVLHYQIPESVIDTCIQVTSEVVERRKVELLNVSTVNDVSDSSASRRQPAGQHQQPSPYIR